VWDFALISWVLGNLFHFLIGFERDLSVCLSAETAAFINMQKLWLALRERDIPGELQDADKGGFANHKKRRLEDDEVKTSVQLVAPLDNSRFIVGAMDHDDDEKKVAVQLVAPPDGCHWVFGATQYDLLFLRDEDIATWTYIRKEFDRVKGAWSQKNRDGLMTFIWCGTPGIGKSWCINYILWQLSKMQVDVVLELCKHKMLFVLKANGEVKDLPFGTTPPELRDEPSVWHVFDPASDGSLQPVSRTKGVTLVIRPYQKLWEGDHVYFAGRWDLSVELLPH
jgi:hypothetical protein